MAETTPFSRENTGAIIAKACELLDTLDFDHLGDVYAKDVSYRSGPNKATGLEDLINNLKHIEPMMAMMKMKHEIGRFDIMSDGLIWSMVQGTFVFKSEPEETIVVSAVATFTRVPPGRGEAGKIQSMDVYEDPSPVHQRVQSLMGQAPS